MSERPREGAGNKGQKQKVMAAASKIWQHKAGRYCWREKDLKRDSVEEEEEEQEERQVGGA